MRSTLAASQQLTSVCPPPMRFKTNSCRALSSSDKTSSSSSTGVSPVSARNISRSASFKESAAVRVCPWEA